MTRRKLFKMIPLVGALPVAASSGPDFIQDVVLTCQGEAFEEISVGIYAKDMWFMTDEQVLDCCDPQLVAEILAKTGRRIE